MLTFINITSLVRVAEEPSLSYTPNQKAVCKFSVAANSSWINESGNKIEEKCFIQCTAWGTLAENINKYVEKGDPLYIDGSLKQDTWEKDGQKHSKHTITVSRCVFLKSKEQS